MLNPETASLPVTCPIRLFSALAAAAAFGRFAAHHSLDTCLEKLFQFIDYRLELAGGQPSSAGGAGEIGLFEPVQRPEDFLAAVRTCEGNLFL
jgi:hypothetical protein